MYNYLCGEVVDIVGNNVILDVNGVGYELGVSNYTLAECKIGQKRKLYVYLQIKRGRHSAVRFCFRRGKKHVFTLDFRYGRGL